MLMNMIMDVEECVG